MEDYNEENIRLAADGMPRWKRIAFMTCCCERMLPNYGNFAKETGFGDQQLLRDALDTVWVWIETDAMCSDAAGLAFNCEKQAPDTEKFSSIYTSAALDAAAAIAITINAIPDADLKKLTSVASLARDSVDLFIQSKFDLDPNDIQLEEKILENRLMQREIRVQRESVELLKGVEGTREDIVKELRRKWSNISKGSLDTA